MGLCVSCNAPVDEGEELCRDCAKDAGADTDSASESGDSADMDMGGGDDGAE